MKKTTKATSLIVTAIASFALVAGELAIFRVVAERSALVARNDCEKRFNILLAGLGSRDDFGVAIDSSPQLVGKILAVGIYKADGQALYRWGDAPASYIRGADTRRGEDWSGRVYSENSAHDSIILDVSPNRLYPPRPRDKDAPPPEEMEKAKKREKSERPIIFEHLRKSETVFLEILETDYWRESRLRLVLFPLIAAALLAAAWAVRWLIVRNAEYRERIEEQRNLVILGTAASTLAHEIKNPLLAIRLQTGILEKTCPDSAKRELSIINSEIERLSGLTYRVNDYLRDPAGERTSVDPAETLRETGIRVCGIDIIGAGDDSARRQSRPLVFIDPERLRSIAENALRNALEAGSPAERITARVTAVDGFVEIEILDRGAGLSDEAKTRLLQPFFTTKSRGTGIGLAICQRFAEAAGGKIAVRNRPDGGAVFSLTLPETGGNGNLKHKPRGRDARRRKTA